MPYRYMDKTELERIRQQLVAGGYPLYWPELSDLMKEEKDYTCEICGVQMLGVLVHHKDWNPSNCDLDNLQVLCSKCHAFAQPISGPPRS